MSISKKHHELLMSIRSKLPEKFGRNTTIACASISFFLGLLAEFGTLNFYGMEILVPWVINALLLSPLAAFSDPQGSPWRYGASSGGIPKGFSMAFLFLIYIYILLRGLFFILIFEFH